MHDAGVHMHLQIPTAVVVVPLFHVTELPRGERNMIGERRAKKRATESKTSERCWLRVVAVVRRRSPHVHRDRAR
jgi:hypothetical protein